MRTRMSGGVGGVRSNAAPIPMYAQHGRELMGCKSPVRNWESEGGQRCQVDNSD